jgi:hypothetical protein
MSRAAAKKLLDTVLRQSGELDAVLIDIQAACTPEEFKEFRKIVGNVMGSVLFDAINPIVAKYPDLKPPELR